MASLLFTRKSAPRIYIFLFLFGSRFLGTYPIQHTYIRTRTRIRTFYLHTLASHWHRHRTSNNNTNTNTRLFFTGFLCLSFLHWSLPPIPSSSLAHSSDNALCITHSTPLTTCMLSFFCFRSFTLHMCIVYIRSRTH
ncbi:hypothetical protein R3P38DRAFT_3079195, partial [Favolaschia claudopus]